MCFGPLVCGTEYEACCRLNLDVAGQRIRNVETSSVGTVPLRLVLVVVVHSNMDDTTPHSEHRFPAPSSKPVLGLSLGFPISSVTVKVQPPASVYDSDPWRKGAGKRGSPSLQSAL